PGASPKNDAASLLGHLLVASQPWKTWRPRKIDGAQHIGLVPIYRREDDIASKAEYVVAADNLLQRRAVSAPQLRAIFLRAMHDQVLAFRPPVKMTVLRAHFAIGRVSHDLGEQSSIGAMFTDREFNETFNRVGGLDGTFRLDKNWSAQYRGYMSSTLDSTGYSFGQHHEGVLVGTGRRFTFSMQYLDITPKFQTETGFLQRVDQRSVNQYGHFYWRPEGKHLILHGPEENGTQLWGTHGTTLQQLISGDYVFGFRRNIIFAPVYWYESDVLRPIDFPGSPGFPGLTSNKQMAQQGGGIVFRGSPW